MKIKRTFLLIEVLIAFTLVALFAPFMIRYPVLHYRSQIRRLESFERQRLADWTFSEIKELLLRQGISWEKLPGLGKEPLTLPLSQVELDIPGVVKRSVSRFANLTCLKQKQGKQGRTFRLYQIDVGFEGTKKKFSYRILVQREPPHESSA